MITGPETRSTQAEAAPASGDHFVQFYEGEDFLVESVAAFIGGGLGAGEGAIIIAEKAHREALEGRLRAQGFDVTALRARRQLILLDARATLEKFMVGGMPDETLFRKEVGSVVEWSLMGRRGLRAFGEMVALLCADGNGKAAVRLERLWNELGRDYVFSLYCAYPMNGFPAARDSELFARICEEHGHVHPTETHAARGDGTESEHLRAIAHLQQKAKALESEAGVRLRAEDAARHLAAIVESSDDAIIGKDLNGIVQSWNAGAERIFGYTAAEMIGRPIAVLIPPQRPNEEPEILSRIRSGLRVDHYETTRVRKDGSMVSISLTISPIRDENGTVVGASKIARDITQRKRDELALKLAREQLMRAKEELERRVEERTASLRRAVEQMEEFSYTVSHDLRAPLRGMQTYARALLEDYGDKLEGEGQHYLNRLSKNAARLDRMILDLLTFSRVAREEQQLERISLDALTREVIADYPALQPPNAEITVDANEDVLGHASSMTQAISNLLNNAVKFVAPGVTPRILVRAEREGGDVRLWVEDNGIGIDPRHQGRLFTMFERLHPNLEYEGTGVGLAIVRKAVERMDGEAGVLSDGKTGSRFWIRLRRAL